MSMMLSPTGSAIGDYEHLTAYDADAGSQRTQIKDVPNPGLRQVLIDFVEAIREPLAPLRSFARRVTTVSPARESPADARDGEWMASHIALVLGDDTPSHTVTLLESSWTWGATPVLPSSATPLAPVTGTDDAVVTIEELSRRVGVPVKDILSAAGVKKSTYHSWKTPNGPTPRVASQGRLWEVAQFVEDLEELLGGSVRLWILADETRRRLFAMGSFSELLELLRSQPRPRIAAPGYATLAAIGGDRLPVDDETEPSRKPRGRAGVAQGAKAADRRRR